MQETLVYLKNNSIDAVGGMYLTVDSLIEIDNRVTSSNNITLRKVNVKPYGFDEMYMDKELIEGKLYQTINKFNERKITSTKFYSILLNKIHPFYKFYPYPFYPFYTRYKMKEIVNKFLLAGDKFMPEMNLRQPGFTYSACGPFTKNKKRIKKLKETGDSRYTYQSELDKACFQHHMADGDLKGLTKRTASHKILRDKEFNIAKNPKYDGYQRGLASIVYKFFNKKTSGNSIKNENMSDQLLAKELHNPIIKKFKKRKVQSSFIDNIWGADLSDMQLIGKFHKGIRF